MPIRQRDINTIQQALGEANAALRALEDTYQDSQKTGYTVTDDAYADPQHDLQQALIDMAAEIQTDATETDAFAAADGTIVPLPAPALDIDPDGLPAFPTAADGGHVEED